jgi:hypothetical protein
MTLTLGDHSVTVSVDDVVLILHDSNWRPRAYHLQGTLANIPLDASTKQELMSEFPRQTGSSLR